MKTRLCLATRNDYETVFEQEWAPDTHSRVQTNRWPPGGGGAGKGAKATGGAEIRTWRTIRKKKRRRGPACGSSKTDRSLALGTGSTAAFFIRLLAEKVKNGLRIRGIPTSVKSGNWRGVWGFR